MAYLTNNPTFDTTLNLMDQEIYLLPNDPFQVQTLNPKPYALDPKP